MSTRLCLSFERTPQWFKNNKLLFHFDKSTCRIVGDLEYLIRRKFAITSVCHLYLDGYLLPSQESIDLVRDGDNLRVENESLSLYHSTDDNNENGILHNTDKGKSQSLSKKRKHSLYSKLPASKYPRSSSGKDKSVESGTESSKSGYSKNDDEYRLTPTSRKSDTSYCTGNTSKSSASSHKKKSSIKQKLKKGNNSCDTKKSSAIQKHKKKKAVASLKENTLSSSESSNSESSSSESDESSSTELSIETESSTTESSSLTEELSKEESCDTETSSTELPSSKSLPPSFPSEASTFESGFEPANSKRYTKKHSSDTNQSSSCSSALDSKTNSGKKSHKRTIAKNNKEISNPSQSSSDQSKETRSTSESASTKPSLAQSKKKSLSITVTNTGCLPSIEEESLDSMPSSRDSVNHYSTPGVPTQNGILPSRISNAKHIHFDSDDDEPRIPEEAIVRVNNGLTLNRGSMSNHRNTIGIVMDRVGNNLLTACNRNIGDFCIFPEGEKVLDFSVLPPLCGPPRVGDRIAYKILEMSASYTPEMSAYKEGVVLAYDPKNGEVLVELTPESLIKPVGDGNISNKFELMSDDEDIYDVSSKPLPVLERKVTVLWSSMVSPKLINS